MNNPMTANHHQTIALAGVLQAANLVEQLARQGSLSTDDIQMMVNAILNMKPQSTLAIYGSVDQIRSGLKGIRQLLGSERQQVKPDVVRYTMSLLHLEKRLQKNGKMLHQLGEELSDSQQKLNYFNDATHDAVIGALARNYQNTLSQLQFRIQVTGNPTYLNQQRNADQIRMILLFGVRSALLWRQLGGKRYHLLLRRKALVNAATDLLQGRVQTEPNPSAH